MALSFSAVGTRRSGLGKRHAVPQRLDDLLGAAASLLQRGALHRGGPARSTRNTLGTVCDRKNGQGRMRRKGKGDRAGGQVVGVTAVVRRYLPATGGFARLGITIDHPPGTLACALVLRAYEPVVQRQVVTYGVLQIERATE